MLIVQVVLDIIRIIKVTFSDLKEFVTCLWKLGLHTQNNERIAD